MAIEAEAETSLRRRLTSGWRDSFAQGSMDALAVNIEESQSPPAVIKALP